MRFFTEEGVDWTPRKTQEQPKSQAENPEYTESHIKVDEVYGFNGERIPLSGKEDRATLFTEGDTGHWQFVTRSAGKPLACGCVPHEGMKIRMFQNGQAVCEQHYITCSLCNRGALPTSFTVINIDQPKCFHRHPCAEYVLKNILRNEKTNPTLPQNTLAYLTNIYRDIKAERSILWSILYWRRSNASVQQW